MNLPDATIARARRVLETCQDPALRLATAESCTGGLIIAALTEIAGSSTVVDRGYVTYDNRAKQEVLGVPAEILTTVGAVSEACARAMAEGALGRAGVDLVVAVTGIAGPGGATPEKPVGLVHFALARRGAPTTHDHRIFPGDRATVRLATVDHALDLIVAAATTA